MVFLMRRFSGDTTIPFMTVAVAALCESGTAAVMAADRLVVSQDFRGEGPDCKIFPVSNGIVILAAGDPPDSEFLKRIREKKPVTVDDASAEVANAKIALQVARRKPLLEMQADVFKVSPEKYLECARNAVPGNQLDLEYQSFKRQSELRLSLVIIGKGQEDHEAHLRVIEDNETDCAFVPRDVNQPGFYSVGIGKSLALKVFEKCPKIKNASIESALYFVYEAKRAAEAESGGRVGKETDLAAILPTGSKRWLWEKEADKFFAILNGIHEKPNGPLELLADQQTTIRDAIEHTPKWSEV
jgi:20S proteasome alpha/beta subunit